MRRRTLVPEIALLAIPGMVILALSVLQESYAQWSTEWNWAWSQWAAQVQLTAPMTGGLAAWLVYDAMRAGRGDWLATTPRGGLVLRTRVIAATIPALAAAVLTGAALPFVVGSGGSARWPLLTAVSLMAAVVGAAALGGLAARLLPRAATAPVVVVVLWSLVVGLLPLGTSWLRVGGAGHSLAGYDIVASLPAHRALTTAAVVGAALVVLSARAPRQWNRLHQGVAATTTAAVAGLVVGSGWFAGGYDIAPDPQASAAACSTGAVATICAMPEHAASLAAARPAIARVVEARRLVGVETAETVRELTPHDLAASGGLQARHGSAVDFTFDPFSPSGAAEAAASVVVPAACFAAQDTLERQAFETSDEALRVLTTWALVVAGQPAPGVRDDPAWARFTSLGPERQAQWLRAALTAADACRYDTFPVIES